MSQYSTVANNAIVDDTNAPAISWSAIIAGSAVTLTTTVVLTLLGVGLGFAFTPPSPDMHSAAVGLTVAAAIWMIVVQWLSAALGGFLTGRLRLKWPGLHTHEVFFRDTAHGFLTWTVATLVMLTVFASSFATAVSPHAMHHDRNGPVAEGSAPPSHQMDPYLYRLFRVSGSSEAAPLTPAQHDESAMLLVQATGNEPIAADDRVYLTHMVEAHTGLSNADAEQRVDNVAAQLKADADKARKAMASATITAVLSMLIGAFIASVAAAIGGAKRDEY